MKQSYNEFLIECLSEYKRYEFADIPEEDEIDYEFSEKYLNEKRKLIKKVSCPFWYYVNTAAKRAAVIFIALIIAGTSLISIEAWKNSILDFSYVVYDDHIEISGYTSQIVHDTIEKCYIVANIPVDYPLSRMNYAEALMYSFSWKNASGKCIYFYQKRTHYGGFTSVSENSNTREKVINGTACLEIVSEEEYQYHWGYDGYLFTLIYPLDLGEEFAEGVIGKLVETDPENYR